MKRKLLLVDDAPFILEVLQEIISLEKNKYEIHLATNGEEAIEKALDTHFDLILMDLALPRLNGFQAVEKITENNRKQKILAMSSLNEPDIVSKAIQVGCFDFLAKPFTVSQVHEILKQAFDETDYSGVANG